MINYLGLLVSMATIIFTLAVTGDFKQFIDIPSILVVFGLTVGLTLKKFGKRGAFFWKEESETRKEMASWIARTGLHSGIFSGFIGVVIISNNLKDLSMLGPAFGVAVLPIFYSYLIYFFVNSVASSSPN